MIVEKLILEKKRGDIMDEINNITNEFIKLINNKISHTKNYSIHQLADDINMSYSTLKSNLSQNAAMSFSTAVKLARHFDIDMNMLILNDNSSQKVFNKIDPMNKDQKEMAYNILKEYVDSNKQE